MRRLVLVFSALCFLIGALAMVLAVTGAWLFTAVMTIKATGWVGGIAFLVLSVWALARYEEYIKTPWNLWVTLWTWTDYKLTDRLNHKAIRDR